MQVMKRPGVEPFLLEMGKRYEVVIYTDEPAMYADPVINKIDPHRAVLYRLYRQETQVRAVQAVLTVEAVQALPTGRQGSKACAGT
jgi:hypothetical protein